MTFSRIQKIVVLWVFVVIIYGNENVTADSAGVIVQNTLVEGFNSLYSPFIRAERLWVGGWMHAPQRVPWPDRIYQSSYTQEAGWSHPAAIRWSGENAQWPPGEKPGYHINDPVVVPHPENGWLLMLYTAFPNDAIDASACEPAINPVDCLDVKRHAVGLALSSDKGVSWVDRGILIEHENGVWSPGAIVVENELWVYYMDAILPVERSSIYLQRLSLVDFTPLGDRTLVKHPGEGMSNPDVHISAGKFFLMGNREKASKVVLYTSDDGLTFSANPCFVNPLIHTPGIRLDGPHGHYVPGGLLIMSTGYNRGGGSSRIVQWRYRQQCGV